LPTSTAIPPPTPYVFTTCTRATLPLPLPFTLSLCQHSAASRRPCRPRHQNKYSGRSNRYFSISDVLIGSGAQQARYYSYTESAVSFPWVKWPESETDHTPQFSAGIKMRGATTPVLLCHHGMVFSKTMEGGTLPITSYLRADTAYSNKTSFSAWSACSDGTPIFKDYSV